MERQKVKLFSREIKQPFYFNTFYIVCDEEKSLKFRKKPITFASRIVHVGIAVEALVLYRFVFLFFIYNDFNSDKKKLTSSSITRSTASVFNLFDPYVIAFIIALTHLVVVVSTFSQFSQQRNTLLRRNFFFEHE